MGYQPADAGRILIDGAEVKIASTRAAQALGIGMVYQHFTLVPNMTVSENLAMARVDSAGRDRLEQGAQEPSRVHGADALPDRSGEGRPLSVGAGERQKIEILKQLYLGQPDPDPRRADLRPHASEADEVLAMLHGMARAGDISILMITHKFREVTTFADDVTVLRRGRVAGQGPASGLTMAQMAEMMVGGEVPSGSASRAERAPGEARLSLRAATRCRRQGHRGSRRSHARGEGR